jgi:hypothetical protein
MGRIPASSQIFIEAVEKLHIRWADLEIENVGIFHDALGVG